MSALEAEANFASGYRLDGGFFLHDEHNTGSCHHRFEDACWARPSRLLAMPSLNNDAERSRRPEVLSFGEGSVARVDSGCVNTSMFEVDRFERIGMVAARGSGLCPLLNIVHQARAASARLSGSPSAGVSSSLLRRSPVRLERSGMNIATTAFTPASGFNVSSRRRAEAKPQMRSAWLPNSSLSAGSCRRRRDSWPETSREPQMSPLETVTSAAWHAPAGPHHHFSFSRGRLSPNDEHSCNYWSRFDAGWRCLRRKIRRWIGRRF